MSDETKDCCPDCKENARMLEALRELATKLTPTKIQERKPIEERKPSPYKESILLEEECEGKAGDMIELHVRSERPVKPQKMWIVERDPGATHFSLWHNQINRFGLKGEVPSSDFSVESQRLSCGIALPTLHVGEAYTFMFRFERDSRVSVMLACVGFRS